MHERFFSFLQHRFSGLPARASELLSDKLISPFTVTLPKTLLEQAQWVVKQLYALRNETWYGEDVLSRSARSAQFDPGNKSICMSYDFHLDPSGTLKLIEVNTNAAFFLTGYFLYQFTETPLPIDFTLETFIENCKEESRLTKNNFNSLAIVDENPTSQRLYIEFLLYEQLFREFGYSTQIGDPAQLIYQNHLLSLNEKKIDFIYNRTTDFYFEQPQNSSLQAAYLNRAVTVSPNPHEYALLADKQRLVEWGLALKNNDTRYANLLPIRQHLLETDLLTKANSDFFWSHKKKYFFKPLTSFGAKGVYRGDGISRVHFEQLLEKQYLAQEYCPPPEHSFSILGQEPVKMKYDLRFYVYQDQLQMVIARLYQGQVTNLRTPLGGFAPVVFI